MLRPCALFWVALITLAPLRLSSGAEQDKASSDLEKRIESLVQAISQQAGSFQLTIPAPNELLSSRNLAQLHLLRVSVSTRSVESDADDFSGASSDELL